MTRSASDRTVASVRLGPPQQRAQPRLQLAQRERLDQVVVGARVEPRDAVVDGVARGEHQHRRPVAAGAHPAAHLQPVDPGHRDVEHDGVAVAAAQRLERDAPVGRERHVVAREPQGAVERRPHRGLVVDHQNTLSHAREPTAPDIRIREVAGELRKR